MKEIINNQQALSSIGGPALLEEEVLNVDDGVCARISIEEHTLPSDKPYKL